VRRGETLSVIAAKYHTSVTALSRANNLKNINHIYVGMNLVIPRAGGDVPASAEPRTSSGSTAVASAPRPAAAKPAAYHTVVRGDTLSEVSTRYGVTMAQVKAWNGLDSSTIQLGQRLKVSAGTAPTASRSSTASTSTASRSHTVARGETLATIAKRYGMSTADLQRLNGIRDASHIEVGQTLKVSGSSGGTATASSQWSTVTVQRGDSLGAIAERNHCSVTELKSWNGLSSSVIQPGQKLKVKRG
jgi:LysM repeat protein